MLFALSSLVRQEEEEAERRYCISSTTRPSRRAIVCFYNPSRPLSTSPSALSFLLSFSANQLTSAQRYPIPFGTHIGSTPPPLTLLPRGLSSNQSPFPTTRWECRAALRASGRCSCRPRCQASKQVQSSGGHCAALLRQHGSSYAHSRLSPIVSSSFFPQPPPSSFPASVVSRILMLS